MFNRFFADKDRFAVQVALGIIFAAALIDIAHQGFRVGQILASHPFFSH